MEDKKIVLFTGVIWYPDWHYTYEQLICDLDYYLAEILTGRLLEQGLISCVQYDLIMAEKRKAFRPLLAEIL